MGKHGPQGIALSILVAVVHGRLKLIIFFPLLFSLGRGLTTLPTIRASASPETFSSSFSKKRNRNVIERVQIRLDEFQEQLLWNAWFRIKKRTPRRLYQSGYPKKKPDHLRSGVFNNREVSEECWIATLLYLSMMRLLGWAMWHKPSFPDRCVIWVLFVFWHTLCHNVF